MLDSIHSIITYHAMTRIFEYFVYLSYTIQFVSLVWYNECNRVKFVGNQGIHTYLLIDANHVNFLPFFHLNVKNLCKNLAVENASFTNFNLFLIYVIIYSNRNFVLNDLLTKHLLRKKNIEWCISIIRRRYSKYYSLSIIVFTYTVFTILSNNVEQLQYSLYM